MYTFLIRSENDSFVDVKKKHLDFNLVTVRPQQSRGGTSLCHLANDMDKY